MPTLIRLGCRDDQSIWRLNDIVILDASELLDLIFDALSFLVLSLLKGFLECIRMEMNDNRRTDAWNLTVQNCPDVWVDESAEPSCLKLSPSRARK